MKSALIQQLLRRNIIVSRRLGQNFLIDPNFMQYLVRTADIAPDDNVLEIGSGPGIFTQLLAGQARTVTAVELDPKLFALSRELAGTISPFPTGGLTSGGAHHKNIRFIQSDILNKNQDGINPEVINQLKKSRPLKVISNLPYKVAVPIIMTLLESHLAGILNIKSMSVMVQLEVAQRLAAPVGSSEYSAVSVLCGFLAHSCIVRKVPPEVFYPRPKVQSAVMSLNPVAPSPDASLYGALKKLVQPIFHYRRKTIRVALEKSGCFSGKETIEMLLSQSGIKGELRPQDIPLTGYLNIVKEISERESAILNGTQI